MQMTSITAQAWQGPFILSLVCALVDGLKQTEKPASARHNRLSRIEETAMRALDVYPDAGLTPQVQDLASAFFEKVETLFRDTLDPSAQRENEAKIAHQRRKRIAGLVHTSVDDCRITISTEKDAEFLREILAFMDAGGIEGKSRRQVIERRIRAIEKGRQA